jgi:hypothetical protein
MVALKLGNVSFDCDDVMRVATFWSTALGRPLDDWSGPQFASIGTTDPDRAQPAWYFAKVPESKRAKNRVHLDLVSAEPTTVHDLVSMVRR